MYIHTNLYTNKIKNSITTKHDKRLKTPTRLIQYKKINKM